jgi:hypothetical protein
MKRLTRTRDLIETAGRSDGGLRKRSGEGGSGQSDDGEEGSGELHCDVDDVVRVCCALEKRSR